MERSRNHILALYGILSFIVILCTIPNFTTQNWGYLLATILLLALYFIRMKWPRHDSFEENHCNFMIKTLWIYSAFVGLGMIGAGIIVGQQANPDALAPMLDALAQGIEPTEEQSRQWMMQYFNDNQKLLLDVSRLWLFPAQVYLVWRITRGAGRAFKNYRIINLKNWF